MDHEIVVLVVEDNPGDVELIEEYLLESRDARFRIDHRSRLGDISPAIASQPIDIVLMDLGLPDSSGLKSVEQFLEEHEAIPVVVITGLDDGDTGRRAVQYGAQDYLVKGEFDGNLLARAILYAIARHEGDRKLRIVLEQKKQLLREVHHRIKNNMASVAGLLSLQAGLVSSEAARAALDEAGKRLHVMERIYEQLYMREDFDAVDTDHYVTNLLDDIRASGLLPETVSVTTNVESIAVSTKQILPIGIIVNELVTNAAKYAFTDGARTGDLYVEVYAVDKPSDSVCISVRDTGPGIPEEVRSGQSGGFGMLLIRAYVEQYNGELSISHTSSVLSVDRQQSRPPTNSGGKTEVFVRLTRDPLEPKQSKRPVVHTRVR